MRKSETILLALFFVFQFGIFYVFATINSLQEDLIAHFRSPFKDAFASFYFFEAACLIIAIFGSLNARIVIGKLGFLTILTSGFVALIGIWHPCFIKDFTERTELYPTLRISFLCPSFSNRSYIGLITHFFIGSLMTVLSYTLGIHPKREINKHLP
jgi:hypothetical protein